MSIGQGQMTIGCLSPAEFFVFYPGDTCIKVKNLFHTLYRNSVYNTSILSVTEQIT